MQSIRGHLISKQHVFYLFINPAVLWKTQRFIGEQAASQRLKNVAHRSGGKAVETFDYKLGYKALSQALSF